jgi:hypothetical protein
LSDPAIGETLGWYVRVFTTQVAESESVTLLYLVGLLDPREAENAVKAARCKSGETYSAVSTAVSDRGPRPMPGEVRELKGAV